MLYPASYNNIEVFYDDFFCNYIDLLFVFRLGAKLLFVAAKQDPTDCFFMF